MWKATRKIKEKDSKRPQKIRDSLPLELYLAMNKACFDSLEVTLFCEGSKDVKETKSQLLLLTSLHEGPTFRAFTDTTQRPLLIRNPE